MQLVQVAIAIAALLDFAIAQDYDSRGAAGGLKLRKKRSKEGGRAKIDFSRRVNENVDRTRPTRPPVRPPPPPPPPPPPTRPPQRPYVHQPLYPPQPYSFDYEVADNEGNTHYRTEQGDANGSVRGTYGYTDAQGLYRIVEYVADENGFRANIRTNEPGVGGKQSPADVVLIAEEPPAGIQDRYTSAGGTSGGGGGGSYRGGAVAGLGGYTGGGRGDYRGGAGGNHPDYKGGSGGGRESFINYAGDAGAGEADGYGSGGFRGKAVSSTDVKSGKSGYRTGN